MYTAQVAGIKGKLDIAHAAALKYRELENIRLAGEQRDDIEAAETVAESAVDMVGPDADADDVADADAAVKALDDAIAAGANLSDDEKSGFTTTADGLRGALGDRKALRKAIMAASTALEGLDNDSSDDDIEAVQDLIDDAEEAIDGAEHLSDDEKAEFSAKIDDEDDGLQAMLNGRRDHNPGGTGSRSDQGGGGAQGDPNGYRGSGYNLAL